MSVEGYVRFAAELRGVSDPAAATRRALDRVGLSAVRPRIIEHLSKGYRQRVGLAQALVHDPDVLVLDEPTSGLDPAQRREIRDLLADLAAGDRTVILSTHVLPEVEAICQRVVIINQGQIVAEDRIDALGAEARRVRVELEGDAGPLAEALSGWPGVSVERVGQTGLRVGGAADRRAELARASAPHGLIELRLEQGLEDVYLALTSKGNT
jgi:ABC-2 type transport system ATP-binding protein